MDESTRVDVNTGTENNGFPSMGADQAVVNNPVIVGSPAGVVKKRFSVPKVSMKSGLVGVMLFAAIGAAGFFWNQSRSAGQQSPEAVEARNQQETESVVSALSSVLLIEGEDKPTVARVEDPEKLKTANKDFYKNVQVGDYLVLYPQRAIIYRQAEKKIVNIAPIVNTAQSQIPQQDVAGESAEKPAETPKAPQGSR